MTTPWTPTLPPGLPLYLGLANAIAGDVGAEVLPPGARLPTQRELATRLQIGRAHV